MLAKRKLAALLAEFFGTGVLTLLVLSVEHSNIGVPFFVAAAAGVTIAVMSMVVAGISEAHFNPAITIAMWTVKKVSTVAGILYIAVQLLGAWAAYAVYTYFANTHLTPIGGHYTTRVLVAEAVGTGIFAFGYAAVAFQRASSAVTSSFYGLAYMIGVVAAATASIALLNPAIALGVRSWVWGTYVLGPVVGAFIAANIYSTLFAAVPSGPIAEAVNSAFKETSAPAKSSKKK